MKSVEWKCQSLGATAELLLLSFFPRSFSVRSSVRSFVVSSVLVFWLACLLACLSFCCFVLPFFFCLFRALIRFEIQLFVFFSILVASCCGRSNSRVQSFSLGYSAVVMSDTERDPPDTVVMKEAFDHTAITTYSHPPQRSSYPFPPLPKHDEAAERMSEASASQQVGPLALPSPQPTTEAEAAAEAELKLQAAERAEDLNLPPRQKVNKPLRVPRSRQNVGNAPGPSAGAGAGAAENGQRKHRQLMAEQVELAAKLRDEANRYLQEEKFVQAVEMYSEAVKVLPKLAPETAICLANRSAAWLALGDFQRAVEDAEQAVRFDCMYFKAHFRLGKALRALADEQSANNAQKPQGGILDSNVAASTGSNEAHAFDAMREAAEQSLSLAKILKKNAASDAAAKKLASYWARVVHERGSIKGLYSMRAKKSHFEMSEEPIGVGNFAKIYTARHKVR